MGAASIKRDATKRWWWRGWPQASTRWAWGLSKETRCELAVREGHGVSPPETSSTRAVLLQHPGLRLTFPWPPGPPLLVTLDYNL